MNVIFQFRIVCFKILNKIVLFSGLFENKVI